MKKYYTGSLEVLKVTNLTVSKQAPSIIQERIVLREDVLFYQNCFGVILCFEDKCPLPTYDEVLSYMDKYLNGECPNGTYYSGSFYDENNLARIEITKRATKKNLVIT